MLWGLARHALAQVESTSTDRPLPIEFIGPTVKTSLRVGPKGLRLHRQVAQSIPRVVGTDVRERPGALAGEGGTIVVLVGQYLRRGAKKRVNGGRVTEPLEGLRQLFVAMMPLSEERSREDRRNPDQFQRVDGDARRALVRRFP